MANGLDDSRRVADEGGLRNPRVGSLAIKLAAVVVGLFLVGVVADTTLAENSMTGVIVGMSWSLAVLIVLVTAVFAVASAVREAFR